MNTYSTTICPKCGKPYIYIGDCFDISMICQCARNEPVQTYYFTTPIPCPHCAQIPAEIETLRAERDEAREWARKYKMIHDLDTDLLQRKAAELDAICDQLEDAEKRVSVLVALIDRLLEDGE